MPPYVNLKGGWLPVQAHVAFVPAAKERERVITRPSLLVAAEIRVVRLTGLVRSPSLGTFTYDVRGGRGLA